MERTGFAGRSSPSRYADTTEIMMKLVLLASFVLLSAAGSARAGDFFVVTDTFKAQRDAQTRAASIGGWALDTDAYSGFVPSLFAVVRGPYTSRQVAEQRLKELKAIKTYKTAYLKDAGTLRLGPAFAKSVPPKVLAALLGELSIVVTDRPGANNPCEPQEPYQDVSVSVVTIDRTYDEKTETDGFKPRRAELDIGGFRVIKRTGEIERMRICAE
jgi:hypothetical protein